MEKDKKTHPLDTFWHPQSPRKMLQRDLAKAGSSFYRSFIYLKVSYGSILG